MIILEIVESCVVKSSHVFHPQKSMSQHVQFDPSVAVLQIWPAQTESRCPLWAMKAFTCAQFGEHLHGVVKSLLAKQIEGEEILDVMYLLLLITVWIILHLLAAKKEKG